MNLNGYLLKLPTELKYLIFLFLVVLSIGFYSSISLVRTTSSFSPTGIEENYLGNESDEHAVEMKFQKSEQQVLGIIHSHIISMSILFLMVGFLVSLTQLNQPLKLFLIIEPFFSILFTFGGIYLLWKGITWFKYIVMISGSLMVLTYTISTIVILYQLCFPKLISNKP